MTATKSTQITRLLRPITPTALPTMPAASTPVPIPFARPLGLRVQGVTDESGTPYVEFVHQKTRLFILLADVHSNAARAVLEAQNIILTKTEWDDLRADVDRLTDFPPRSLAKRPGWTGPCHVLPDGTVIAPPGSGPAVPLFELSRARCRSSGTLKAWKRDVTLLVKTAPIPTFALMTSFASPLLAVMGRIANLGVGFVSLDRDKLDSLQWLATSVVGSPYGTTRERYALSGAMPPIELLSSLSRHADLPLIIADLDLYAASATKRARGARVDELLVGLADGGASAKPGITPVEPARFVFLMTSGEPISGMLARLRPIENDRAADHVFTVPMADRLKRGSSLARKVQSLTTAQYGTPMIQFLTALVKARSEDEAALRQRLLNWISAFRKRVAPATTNLATDRAIAAFGLIYAAGRLAKDYGALPKSFNCMNAAIACYDANRASVAGQEPFLNRLKALAAHPRTMRIDPNNLQSISDSELDRLPAILRANPHGTDELLLTPAALSRTFPNKKLLFRDPSLAGIIKHDGKRHTVKRAVRIEKVSDRLACFTLP